MISITYQEQRLRGQALADFISEFSYQSEEEIVPVEANGDKIIASKIAEAELNWQWKLYVDGSSNESGAGTGLLLESLEGAKFRAVVRFGFATSNNEAEYEAFLACIELEREMGGESLISLSDSQLVVNQVT